VNQNNKIQKGYKYSMLCVLIGLVFYAFAEYFVGLLLLVTGAIALILQSSISRKYDEQAESIRNQIREMRSQ
jgi:hypothetical protein